MRDSTLADLDDLLRKAKSARSKLEPIWYLNLAYYMGEQWIAWDGRGLFRPNLKPNRITIVDNRIQPCVRTEIAKMTKKRPVFTVVPQTADDMDAHAVEIGEKLMRYLWKHLHLTELTYKALLWSRITGAGFIKAFWDPTMGDGADCVVGPSGKVLSDAQGKPFHPDQIDPDELSKTLGVEVTAKKVNQGDVRVEVRSPFQMYLDPLADSFSECEWLIEESVKSIESVKRQYGVTVPADSTANPGLIESRMGAVFMPGTGSYKGAKIREYWCKPNGQHPNGRRAVWCKDEILFEDNSPFDPFPYVMLSGIPIPGRLWPTSIVEQLRGPQTELNKVKSQIAENRNRIGNPTILASKQAVQDPDKFTQSTTMPGGIYFFDDLGSPNAVPTYLGAPALPQYVTDEIARIEESIQEISGQHEVTSANVPPGVTAASAINLLMEADDTRMGPAITDYELNLGLAGQKIMKLAAKYYTDARTIRIGGDNGVWQIFDFRGAMLRDNTQVEVQAGSAFPQSKAVKQAAMQDLLTLFVQSGNPPHGRQLAQFLQDWDIGGADRLVEEYTRDESQANRENVRMSQDEPVPINLFDNDQAHVDAHQDFRKEQRYLLLGNNEQQIIAAHVAAHKARIAQQAAAQMQQQAEQQGQPPPGQAAQQGQMEMQGQAQQQGQQASQAAQQQQIAAAQAQQKLHEQAQQAGQQQASQGQQAGQQAAGTAQQQRQAEELHQQALRHKEEQHQQNLARAQQQAQAQAQAQQQQQAKAAQPQSKGPQR